MDKCRLCCHMVDGMPDKDGQKRLRCVKKNTFLDSTDHPRCRSFLAIEDTIPERYREAFRKGHRNITGLP